MDSAAVTGTGEGEATEAALRAAGATIRRGSLGSVLHVDLSSAAQASIDWSGVACWLCGCEKLRELKAVGCPLEPEIWLEVIRALPNLIDLDLAGTLVDDRIFEVAAGLPKLKLLGLSGTRVTEEAVARERRRLIRIRIIWREG